MYTQSKNKIALLVLALLVAPLTSFANVDASLNTNGSYTTGTDSQFDVTLVNYQSSSDVSVLSFSDADANDIKSAMFLDQSGWVTLTPYQSGSDVIAKFISDTGFTVNGNRVITLRVNFRTPKTYVAGYSLQDANSQTFSSAAAPMTVTGPVVLGQSTTATSTFTRQLSYGSSGSDVTALQNKLTAEGFYSGPITGFFGRLTQAGVRAYQSGHGITANGVVGPATLAALNQ
jgi:hypothetical protein